MNACLMQFQDKHYEYKKEQGIKERGSMIEWYTHAWLAELVAAYILENSKTYFKRKIFFGIYRDGRICNEQNNKWKRGWTG